MFSLLSSYRCFRMNSVLRGALNEIGKANMFTSNLNDKRAQTLPLVYKTQTKFFELRSCLSPAIHSLLFENTFVSPYSVAKPLH